MRLATLTFLATALNAAIDSGRYDNLTVDEVRYTIRAGTVFSLLKMTLGIDIDLSLMEAADEAALLAEWEDMEAALDADRTCKIRRRGLSLLMAFLLEGIQRHARTGA